MAESNQLSLSNLEGVKPSISQENKQVTNDLSLSNLEGVKTDYPSITKQTDTTLSSEGPVVPDV